jgi:hypothetical protein
VSLTWLLSSETLDMLHFPQSVPLFAFITTVLMALLPLLVGVSMVAAKGRKMVRVSQIIIYPYVCEARTCTGGAAARIERATSSTQYAADIPRFPPLLAVRISAQQCEVMWWHAAEYLLIRSSRFQV